ncbi:hypothetical protein E4U41_004602 [Claviceps citrina]|nr:hypothetical protein E4U41_004602 [Claviceps citrina]
MSDCAEPDLPQLSYQGILRPLIHRVSIKRLHRDLEHLTSYYTRYFGSETGERSAVWLHDQIAEADAPLTKWASELANEYLSIPANIYKFPDDAGSDSMSFTCLGYPAAFAFEGNPSFGGFPGEFDPYVHTEWDTWHINDKTGTFLFEAGWDNKW